MEKQTMTEEEESTPTTPVVNDDTPRSPDDPNEVLYGHDELSEDEEDDLE